MVGCIGQWYCTAPSVWAGAGAMTPRQEKASNALQIATKTTADAVLMAGTPTVPLRRTCRPLRLRAGPARGGAPPRRHRAPGLALAGPSTFYGTMVQPNIMLWSSWARLWQCAT